MTWLVWHLFLIEALICSRYNMSRLVLLSRSGRIVAFVAWVLDSDKKLSNPINFDYAHSSFYRICVLSASVRFEQVFGLTSTAGITKDSNLASSLNSTFNPVYKKAASYLFYLMDKDLFWISWPWVMSSDIIVFSYDALGTEVLVALVCKCRAWPRTRNIARNTILTVILSCIQIKKLIFIYFYIYNFALDHLLN